MEANEPKTVRNAQAASCAYLLLMLLQRVEQKQSGFISELIAGVKADQDGISKDVPDKEYVDQIFSETLSLLQRAKNILNSENN